jgi:hypothetical protein
VCASRNNPAPRHRKFSRNDYCEKRRKYAWGVDRELYARTISGLVDYYEGYPTLALILNVSVDELRRWAEGRSRPPTDVFLRIVDLARRPPGTLRAVN